MRLCMAQDVNKRPTFDALVPELERLCTELGGQTIVKEE